MAAIIKPRDYPTAYEDPDPVTPEATVDAQKALRRVITSIGDVMYGLFSSGISIGKELRTIFMSAFAPISRQHGPKV